MSKKKEDLKMISKLMIRLLPIQILLAAVGSINAIVSSYFASNFVGVDAMSAVGLFGPINSFVSAVSTIFVGGAAIVCGKYIGQSDRDEVKSVFTSDMIISALISIVFTAALFFFGFFNLTGIITNDPSVRPLFNGYVIGQAIGMFPLVVGNQLTVFLSLENKQKLSIFASGSFIVANLILNYLFVQVYHMEAWGLALASSLGMWVFCLVEMLYFLVGKTYIGFDITKMQLSKVKEIFTKGLPGAISYIYMTARGFIVNYLILAYVGSVGISAFAAANNLMNLFWAVPGGMLAVSRLLISIGMGEEDRHTLTGVMKIMFTKYLQLQMFVIMFIILCAVPLTNIFFHDPTEPVYMMTVWGFRIMPLCMPFSIICMHFTCYGQASGKNILVNILAAFDGVIGVSVATYFLIGKVGMNAVYLASVINGIITTIIILLYSIFNVKHFPRKMPDLMVIPEDFGVSEENFIAFDVCDINDVATVSEKIQRFCEEREIDHRRAMLAGLAMEEMAGNVVEHGFTKDNKKHTIIIKVTCKENEVLLRIKDDCVAFDPQSRNGLDDTSDPTRNVGIRMLYKIAKDVYYQNVLGLNVLSVKI